MRNKPRPPTDPSDGSGHLDQLLDEALEESFPASDPVAIQFDEPSREIADEEDRR
ncbi:MAG: hypothetical protein JSS04_17480 [Proteobacteria bacterium]|nr:hypothetical protein [Pseudomonadota bacterium]